MKTADFRFLDSRAQNWTTDKVYAYFVTDEEAAALKIGSIAVVHNGTEFAFVRCVGLPAAEPKKATKPLVAVLDKDAYDARVKKLTELRQLRAQIEERIRIFDETERLKMLAERDPELAALVAQLNSFSV